MWWRHQAPAASGVAGAMICSSHAEGCVAGGLAAWIDERAETVEAIGSDEAGGDKLPESIEEIGGGGAELAGQVCGEGGAGLLELAPNL